MTSSASAPGASDLASLVHHAEHVVTPEDLGPRLSESRPLRVKLGVDPTVAAITLGWAVPLRKLRQFQDAGHTAVLIMGDMTARIGDPSGKSVTRPQLPVDVVKANAEACVAQLLDILSEERLEVRYNSEWLEPLDLPGVLRLTSEFTVAQMLERDDFAGRFRDSRPISIVEFMYPLMQAYDSVAVEADVELGGTDQLFNLLVGRDLQRAFGQAPQVALTMPLLVGTDGTQKMSQSLGNYIAIRDPAPDMFGKLMSIPDRLLAQYAALAAWMDDAELKGIQEAADAGGPPAAAAKRHVAGTIVALYHGDKAAADAAAAFDRTFVKHQTPERIEEAPIPPDAVDNEKVYLPRVLAELGLASSRGEARRLIAQGGVKLNGETVDGEEMSLSAVRGGVLQVGKRRFVRLSG